MENEIIKIYTDGATIGRNGKLGTVKEVGLGMYIPQIGYGDSKRDTGISNNEAEFKALIWAMTTAIDRGITKAVFYLDSKIVVNRAKGKRPGGKWKNERMDAFQTTVLELKKQFEDVRFQWIPREQNDTADYYSNLAKQL